MVDNVVDPETGLAIGLRVFGDYSLKVVAPDRLILNLVGTQGLLSNDQITDWMRDQLLKVFRTDVVAHITTSAGQSSAPPARTPSSGRRPWPLPPTAPTRTAYTPPGWATSGIWPNPKAAGDAMEGSGEGAAKGGEGSAPAVVAGMGMAGAIFSAASATRTAPCPRCGVQVAGGAKFCPSCGAEQPIATP